MRLRIAVIVCVVLAHAAPARAYVPERTPHRDTEAAGRRLVADPNARGTIPGVLVARGGRTVFAVNPDDTFVPASLIKLATTTAAMTRFGPDHRFATRVLIPRAGGRASVAAIYLVGGGDSTLATEAFRHRRYLPKPTDLIKEPAFPDGSPTVEQLARGVARAGVRTVQGDLIVDESLFDAVRTRPGWLPSYTARDPDTGLLSALSVNEGRADLEGDILVPSPAVAAGTFLKRALAQRGVEVTGAVRIGRAPADGIEVARTLSPPMRDLVAFVNRYSINFHAEVLLKAMGARFGQAGTSEEGIRLVRDSLSALGVPLGGFQMTDGSGLSLLDRATPRTMAAILERMLTRKGEAWDALRASLPVAGRPGTLLRRMRAAPAGGNLRGKTGQVRFVRAMAGWVTGADGIPLVYVTMFNRARSPFALTTPLDTFGQSLARFPG